jgi:hypothetical protein
MTYIEPETVSCAVCGHTKEITEILSTYYSGCSDMDCRPPELARGCIYWAINYCEKCGYAAYDLTTPPQYPEILRSKEYRSVLNHKWLSVHTKAYLCNAFILRAENELTAAARSTISAAWVCDDSGYWQGSTDYRLQALRLIEAAHTQGQLMTDNPASDMVLVSDLFRRCSQFDKAAEAANKGLQLSPEGDIPQLLNYELQLVKEQDSASHTMDDAFGIAGE